jgi:hypothetical protein
MLQMCDSVMGRCRLSAYHTLCLRIAGRLISLIVSHWLSIDVLLAASVPPFALGPVLREPCLYIIFEKKKTPSLELRKFILEAKRKNLYEIAVATWSKMVGRRAWIRESHILFSSLPKPLSRLVFHYKMRLLYLILSYFYNLSVKFFHLLLTSNPRAPQVHSNHI